MDDSDINKIRSGDLSPLDKPYKNLRKKFNAYIQNKYSSVEFIDEIAKDVYQETFVVLYDNIKINRLKKLDFSEAYIFSIGNHKVLELIRKESKHTRSINIERFPGDSSEDESEKEIRTKRIKQAIDDLPKTEQKIMKLCFFEERKTSDIAIELGLTYDSVKTIKSRALDKLKNKLIQNKSLNYV